MTAICAGGGTSSSKPGFGETVVASAATFANMFLNSPSPWAAALAGAMAATAYDLTTFCASDPPALVVPSALEWAQFIGTSTPIVVGPISSVVRDFFAYYAWFAFCKCDAGAPPVASTAAEPAGTPQLNPPVPGAPSAPCDTIVGSTAGFGPGATLLLNSNTELTTLNPTSIRVVTTTSVSSGTGPADSHQLQQFGSGGGAALRTDTWTVPHTGVTTRVFPAAPGLSEWILKDTFNATTGVTLKQDTVDVFCNGEGAGGVVSPCCPPDPGLVAMLSQIQQMVTLIQRQASPFSYVYGANHVGLTGHGSFAVSGLLGVSVAPTTIPSSYGLEVGSPIEYFGLGFITLGTADGWTTSRPLDHDGTLMIPPSAGVFTSIGYTLAPGIVADIRELVREP
jgi:hypothetical protein